MSEKSWTWEFVDDSGSYHYIDKDVNLTEAKLMAEDWVRSGDWWSDGDDRPCITVTVWGQSAKTAEQRGEGLLSRRIDWDFRIDVILENPHYTEEQEE